MKSWEQPERHLWDVTGLTPSSGYWFSTVYSNTPPRGLSLDTFLPTFTVTDTTDADSGSLRQQIDNANAHTGASQIVFNIPNTDPHFNDGNQTATISPASGLPNVAQPVTIDGTSETAFLSQV